MYCVIQLKGSGFLVKVYKIYQIMSSVQETKKEDPEVDSNFLNTTSSVIIRIIQGEVRLCEPQQCTPRTSKNVSEQKITSIKALYERVISTECNERLTSGNIILDIS